MGEAIAFYTLSAFILGFAVMVVSTRNTVHSVLFLVLNFLFVAALYVQLRAEFLAVIQVLVYARVHGVGGQHRAGWLAALHQLSDSVRDRVDAAPGGDDWGNSAGQKRAVMITPTHYMLLSAALFMIGVIGVMVRRNIIIIFMSI